MIESLLDAVQFVWTAQIMRDDLPDGQWEELRDVMRYYVQGYGKVIAMWPTDVKNAFLFDVKMNYLTWL